VRSSDSLPPAGWHFLTLEQWRRAPVRVTWMRQLQEDPLFRQFLGMLHHEARIRGVTPMEPTAIALEFGRSEGRLDVLSWIEDAARPVDRIMDSTKVTPLDYGVHQENDEEIL
jgi:hypothetical protein